MTDTMPTGRPQRRALILIATMMAAFMVAVEATIVATAIPSILTELGGFPLLSWVFSIYLLTQAVSIPIYGRLADLYGRRRVFFTGSTLFLLGTTLCGLSTSMVQLICFRALQGIGAGAIMPIVMTVLADIYPPAERAKMQGYLASVWGFSAIAGPALGAVIVSHFSWSAVFWINLPIGAAAITLLALFFHEPAAPRNRRIDYVAAALVVVSAGALMLGMLQAAVLSTPILAGLLVIVVAGFVAVFVRERDAAEPILRTVSWRDTVIARCNIGSLAIGAVMMGVIAFVPTYVQAVNGGSALLAGFALTAMSIGWSTASAAAGQIMVRTSYRTTAVAGGLSLVAGNAVLLSLSPSSGVSWIALGAVLVGFGMGGCNTTFLVTTQTRASREERASATATMLFMRMIGQAFGAALFGAIVNFELHRRIPQTADPIGLLVDPATRAAMPFTEFALTTAAVSGTLSRVYQVALLFAAVALVVAIWMPRGLRPQSAANAPR
jgi:EmrB/QacA subfamily drug resistance transporter